jgi:outer membrane protein OmpA-like peptidoglycan-associated protein
LNARFHSTVEIRNKALLTTAAVSNDAGFYKSDYYYYERPWGATNEPFALKQVYPTEFWRDAFGRFRIEARFYMPVVRDVPVFPDRELAVGDEWRATGSEVHDLAQYGIGEAYAIPIDARYRYLGVSTTNVPGKTLHRFSVDYAINRASGIDVAAKRAALIREAERELSGLRSNRSAHDARRLVWEEKLGRLEMAPVRISGVVSQAFLWDAGENLPHDLYDKFHFAFHLFNGEVHEYKGYSQARITKIVPVEESIQQGMITRLTNQAERGVEVRRDGRGIVVSLSDILFDHDSFELHPAARRTLEKIAGGIGDISRHEIRIEGHTDNSGTAAYNLELSKKRAEAVAAFLAKRAGIPSRRLSWIGHGMDKPVAPNATREGRARNRRVEIVILTNE